METLEDFLNKIEKTEGKACLDVDSVIDSFKSRVAEFYKYVTEDWLKALIESHKINYSLNKISITENDLGTYSLDEMVLTFGKFVIRLTPIGTILLGTIGRIDMTYEGKSRMFVLIDECIKNAAMQMAKETKSNAVEEDNLIPKKRYVWKYISDIQLYTYEKVDKQSFQNLIVGLIDGK